MRLYLVYCLATALLFVPACKKSGARGRVIEPNVSDSGSAVPGSVAFDIEPVEISKDGSFSLMARYTSQGKTAKFRVELGPAKTVDANAAQDFPMKTGEGRFVAEAGSDASVLLLDLKKALEAKVSPSKIQRLKSLPFTYVNLGDGLSQASRGGFNAKPPGDWTAIKIFIGGGEEEAEVFLNVNPAMRKGQFSIKDADYGDLLLAQLAKVL